jgi:hypothetical protein
MLADVGSACAFERTDGSPGARSQLDRPIGRAQQVQRERFQVR